MVRSPGTPPALHLTEPQKLYHTSSGVTKKENYAPSDFSNHVNTKFNTTNERSPMITTVFAATTPKNMPFAYRASSSTNPNPMISPAFVEENYESERWNQMHEPNQEATLTLRPRSPVARRQRERVMEFEEASNMEGSRRGRNAEGIRS
ncbi:hypothetical protein Tco_0144060 [Tanacetum coccineum]